MRRRKFITLLGGAAAAWPLVARAQQPGKARLIGALMPFAEGDEEAERRRNAFQRGLEAFGWTNWVRSPAPILNVCQLMMAFWLN